MVQSSVAVQVVHNAAASDVAVQRLVVPLNSSGTSDFACHSFAQASDKDKLRIDSKKD